MNCIRRMLLLFLVVCMAVSIAAPVCAARERKTIVRVGFPIQAGISYIDENGDYAGYLVDYLEQISLYTGWEYEYVQADGDTNTQLSTLLGMLSTGEIDMMGTMNRTEALEEMYYYPNYSYGTAYTTLAVAEDAQKWIEGDYANWDGITVATYPGFSKRLEQLDQFAQLNGFKYYEIQYDTYSQAYDAVLSGEADSTLQVDISMNDGLRSIARFSPTPYYFALNKENTVLLQELNVALNNMNRAYPHLQTELYNRYFAGSNDFFLSSDNIQLIQDLGTVKVLFFKGNAPFQHTKKGEISGFAASYFENFSQLTGLSYEPVIADSYEEGLSLIQNGEVDIIACIPTNSELISSGNLRLSIPYFTSSNVVVCSQNTSEHNHDETLSVSLNAEDSLNTLGTNRHNKIRIDSYSLNYYLRKKGLYDHLYVDWTSVHTFSYGVAVTNHIPEELLTIFNHYSSSLGDATRQNMLYQSFADDVEYSLSELLYVYRVEIIGIVVLVGLLLCITILRYKGKQAHQQMKASENKLKRLSRHDELTGAYNGTYFRTLLEEACRQKVPLALVALNIRNFRYVNETYGVAAADEFLCRIKGVLSQDLQEGELFCRQSADTFYLALHEENPQQLSRRIKMLCADIRVHSKNLLDGYPVLLYSGGVLTAHSPDPYSITNLSYMMAALAKAKKEQQTDLCLYDQKLHESEQMRHYVESHMQSALAQEEFKLYLQPKINLQTGALEGAEALVRWQSQDRGMIFPDQFIPLFEENGFCAQLDLYMVKQVCKQLNRWRKQGYPLISISVNQTKLLFYSPGYVDKLLAITKKYDIPPQYITLEILEGLVLENLEKFNQSIEQLKSVGFRISMDDFGSGYSSLNTLGKIKIDELKLDRLFLMDVAKDTQGNQQKVLASIVSLAKELYIHTVVEGVETEENERMMVELSCDSGQGYYYSRPIPTDQFLDNFLKHVPAENST